MTLGQFYIFSIGVSFLLMNIMLFIIKHTYYAIDSECKQGKKIYFDWKQSKVTYKQLFGLAIGLFIPLINLIMPIGTILAYITMAIFDPSITFGKEENKFKEFLNKTLW